LEDVLSFRIAEIFDKDLSRLNHSCFHFQKSFRVSG